MVRDWLRAKNIDDTGLVLENGSGLSRKEMIAPVTLAQTLRAAHTSPWASEFLMSLPIVGIDGAMRNRLKDTKAIELGRMKTGGLRNVTSVAGYLPDANNKNEGETLVVVLFLNHDNARGAKGRAVLDEIMKGFVQRAQ
jgi:serine-type D-Ala-D-Ala carboxypeptidase/endopeptidase (penicillin-binding protein 4)